MFNRDGPVYTRASQVLLPHYVARAVRHEQSDIHVLGCLNEPIEHIEAMGEDEGLAGSKVRSYRFVVDRRLGRVSQENTYDIGLARSFGEGQGGPSVCLKLLVSTRFVSDDDAEPAVAKIQSPRAALNSVTEYCDHLVVQWLQGHVVVPIYLVHHVLFPLLLKLSGSGTRGQATWLDYSDPRAFRQRRRGELGAGEKWLPTASPPYMTGNRPTDGEPL